MISIPDRKLCDAIVEQVSDHSSGFSFVKMGWVSGRGLDRKVHNRIGYDKIRVYSISRSGHGSVGKLFIEKDPDELLLSVRCRVFYRRKFWWLFSKAAVFERVEQLDLRDPDMFVKLECLFDSIYNCFDL